MANRNESTVVSVDVICKRCSGSGVNSRLGNQNCISCRGKGYMDVADQMREQIFERAQAAKGLVQKFENMKKFMPNLYETAVKSDPKLKNRIDEARLLLHEYERNRTQAASGY